MPLTNLPEDYLLRKIPEGIVAEDVRRLVAAVIGGYQERVADIRSAINAAEQAYTPSHAAPALSGYTTVELVYTGDAGETVRRCLDITDDTPDTDDTEALQAWALEEADIGELRVISVTPGNDALRTVSVQTLDLLGDTLGVYLVTNPLHTAAQAAASKRSQIAAFFHRLKIKGTALSFELLGKAMGFDDVKFAPLWQRAVPHVPDDAGNPANDSDFAREPDIAPAELPDPDGYYDPSDLDDGPYYEWSGTALSIDPEESGYVTSINGKQPWLEIVVTGTPTRRPSPGTYRLSGGDAYRRASVALTDEITAVAVGAGDTYNGLTITVTDDAPVDGVTLTTMAVYDRLSKRKYRSSWFDLGAAVDTESFVNLYGTIALKRNPDVFSAIATLSGTCVSNGLPLTGNTQGVFESASPGAGEFPIESVMRMGAQWTEAIEYVRPATRHLRRLSVGMSWTDEVGYAPYDYIHNLTNAGSYVTGAATGYPADVVTDPDAAELVYDGILSIGGVTYYTGSHYDLGASVGHAAEFTYIDAVGTYPLNVETLPDSDIHYVTGSWCTGTYNAADRTYFLTKTGLFSGTGTVYANWRVSRTDVIRSEPLTYHVRECERPEDELQMNLLVETSYGGAPNEDALVDELGDSIVDELGDEIVTA